jgi:hypothetical protein
MLKHELQRTLSFNSFAERLTFFMSLEPPSSRPLPLALRLAGLWLIWAAWCSCSGWLLSAVHQLDGFGYAALLPVLIGCGWFWLKSTAPAKPISFGSQKKFLRRLRQPAPLVYFAIVVLSLLGGLLYAPWSFDAASYRLPRIFYWWSAQHWHWIGTLDHRLDFSSAGFEWQMLSLIVFTRSDRFLFLLNWLPFLLLPGLVFVAFRALGVNGRSARRWMWLLPSAYCIALQCGSVQNDGYSVNFLLAAIAFAVIGGRAKRLGFILLSLLAAALLTGAKVSNVPLLLPLGVLLLPALGAVRWLDWKVPLVLFVALLGSFAPSTFLCWKHTGDWSGNPDNQWNVKTHGAAPAIAANLTILLNDAAQPPYLPGSRAVNARLEPFNHGALISWMERAHGEFSGVNFGEIAYEGGAGPGIGLAAYAAILILGSWLVTAPKMLILSTPPWAIRFAPWLAWISYFVLLAKLGSNHSARIATPYYPLLLVTLLRCPRVAAFERKKISGAAAVLAAAMVLPVIFLTPARPLIPIQTLARVTHRPALEKIAEQYRFWDCLRDELAPLRAQLPPDATRLGYAAGFHDTPYGLFQPLGSREIVELGLPLGSGCLPPPDLKYAVVTERGLQERVQLDLKTWLDRAGGEIIFTYPRNVLLDAHSAPKYESWYLVKLNKSATNHFDAPHESTR